MKDDISGYYNQTLGKINVVLYKSKPYPYVPIYYYILHIYHPGGERLSKAKIYLFQLKVFLSQSGLHYKPCKLYQQLKMVQYTMKSFCSKQKQKPVECITGRPHCKYVKK